MTTLDDVPAAILSVDADRRLTGANSRSHELFGTDPTGAPITTVLPAGLPAPGQWRVTALRNGNVPFTADVDVSEAGVLVVSEVDGRRLLEQADTMLGAAFDGVPLGMALFDTNGVYFRVNGAMCALLGRSRTDLLGRSDLELTHVEDRQADITATADILAGVADTHTCEKRYLRPNGTTAWVLSNLVFLRGDGGHPMCWVGTFQDITARKRSEHRLRHLADHDSLTGIPNRRRLMDELERRLRHASRDGERGAVLLLDLDGFKEVNDTHGHDAGDELLSAVATALGERLRSTDVLGRLGGDEFAVILAHVDSATARVIADELLDAVRKTSPTGVTASCGVAPYTPSEAVGVDELMARADRAMYAAKAAGRDVAVLASEAASSASSASSSSLASST
jgi:diguanylate cyclase (GGDEF)-like protein/PAS domain S-box-containing protein